MIDLSGLGVDLSLLPNSRIHPVSDPVLTDLFLKREDESGCGIAGGKKRKFASLLPWLFQNQVQEVILIGSRYSNNILAAAQLLKQQGFKIKLFLKESFHEGPGNSFLTEILVPRFEWAILSSDQWPNAEQLAHNYAEQQGHRCYVVPEGCFCVPALAGCLSLPKEIMESDLVFDQLFMDAGTGLSAIALLLGLAQYSEQLPVVHLVLMAMDKVEFESRLLLVQNWAKAILPDRRLPAYVLHRPVTARSFGSVNRSVLEGIKGYARKWGVLTDPIYSVKLFMTAEVVVKKEGCVGKTLLVHSGGLSSLPGFYEKLNQLL